MSAVYDPNVVRGSATFPPPGPGVVPLAGFADGEFATPEYNQGDAVTHTAVDGLSVHTKARDTAGGALRIRLQYGSDSNTPLQALANYQFAQGKPGQLVRGVVVIVDPNRARTYTLTDAVLSNNPIGAYANEAAVIEYVFRGMLSVTDAPIPAVPFGPSAIG